MLKHIVMWKLIESDEKEENLKKMKSLLEGLDGKIDQLLKIEVALNPVSTIGPMDIVLYSEFNSFEDLEIYANHPEHVKVGAFIKSVVESRSAVDYEV